MSTRKASHAGDWYTADRNQLDRELTSYLAAVQPSNTQVDLFKDESEGTAWIPPVKGCKAIIAPHAGYYYSGAAAAWAYKCIDTTAIKRVFILGPSHHVRLNTCALSQCVSYETPLGSLPLDLETIAQLKSTREFSTMSLKTDEDEHSIEMHLPYVRKIFEGKDIKIVPVLVGSISREDEGHFGRALAPYLSREDTLAVISSDFCHWGQRFSYTFYYPSPLPLLSTSQPVHLSRRSGPNPNADHPIWASITDLDKEAMSILSLPSQAQASDGNKSPSSGAHVAFSQYLAQTGNTICGRHPIGVLLGALDALESSSDSLRARLQWTRYEQSSKCMDIRDSSVSYASAFVVF